ncbi:MAG: phenylacetate--CoA ligase family protein [bacterium]
MNYYRLPPDEQRKRALGNLLRYIREYVLPYHPHYRPILLELGAEGWKGYEDFLRLPVTTKEDYRRDPLSFILQPRFPGRDSPYDTARIPPKILARYLAGAILNRPKDFSPLFRRLPLLEGRVGHRVAWEWMPVHYHLSAGTTGEPIFVAYTLHDLRRLLPELAAQNLLQPDRPDPSKPALRWDTRTMNLFPGAPHLAFFQAVIMKFLLGISVFDTGGGKVIPTERQVEAFSRGGFNGLSGVPSYVVHWLQTALEMRESGRIGPLSHLEGVALGGEPVSPALRSRIRDLARELGAHPKFRILESFGMTEAKWAFLECDDSIGVHLDPRFFFWEILDPTTLQPVGDGEPGVLVFSHIGWRGTVFLRYNTGDLIHGGMVRDVCPHCGYTFPRLQGPICRAEHDFTKIKGTRVEYPALVDAVREVPGVKAFQIVIGREEAHGRDILEIRVLPDGDRNWENLSDEIRRNVRRRTEVTPDLIRREADSPRFEEELFARSGIKAEYVVDKRPRNDAKQANIS